MTSFYGPHNPITGRTVLYWVIAFFVIIFAANGVFVYFALSSWPGLSTDNAYEKGLRYNATLAEGAAQQKLGWRSSVVAPKGQKLEVRFSGSDGNPLPGLEVTAAMVRPSHEGYDVSVKLRSVEPGLYVAPVTLGLKGHWMVEVNATNEAGDRYKMIHEIDIAP